MRQVVRVAVFAFVATLAGPAVADSGQAEFYRAYYLEHAEQKLGEAEEIYTRLAREADGALQRQARARRDGLREERLADDLARLMPPNALAYVEINQPGKQAERLLDQLGLLAEEGEVREPGRFAISPSLIRAVAGLKGVAAAVTGFDPSNEMVAGVVVLHPGDLEVIRGVLETALPVAAEPVDAIDGFTTYSIEGEVFVTLTRKLVVISAQQHEITGVIDRVRDADAESLADSPHMRPLLEQRQGGLVYFAVNFEPIMPLLEAALAGGAAASEEVAAIDELFDPRSLRSLVGQAGVAEDGLFLDLELALRDSHRNLVFNFLQLPPLDREALARIPHGAAGFIAASLNPRRGTSPPAAEFDRPLPVSGMDIGREVFGNIVGVAAFVLPPGPGPQTMIDDEPIPDFGLVLTVNDPARSQALWTTALGVASLAANEGRADTGVVTIDGVRAYRYGIDEVDLYVATTGTDLIVSPSRHAITQALATRGDNDSLTGDPVFAETLRGLDEATTIVAGVHPGRCMEIASAFMDEHDLEELAPIRDVFDDTVASIAVAHGRDTFRLSGRVVNLPNVGGLVSQLIAEERNDNVRHAYRTERREAPRRPRHGAWQQLTDAARGGAAADELVSFAESVLREVDDAHTLNEQAWALLTEGYSDEVVPAARRLALRCNELSDFEDWAFLDTLALAEFRSGRVEDAIRLQRKAVEQAHTDREKEQAKEALKKFERGRAR